MSLFFSFPSFTFLLPIVLIAGIVLWVLFRRRSQNQRVDSEKPWEMLRQLSWLAGLSDEEFRKVARSFRLRSFPKGAMLLKEKEPDNGLFLIVEGEVKVEIRGIIMGEAGAGKLLGEMAFLTGHPRTATVLAETAVKVLWIKRAALRYVMKKSPQLENGLWEFASMRYAMNLLGKREPFSLWEQKRFIQWLSVGEVKLPNENGWIDMEGKVGVLVIGTAAQHDGSIVVKAPHSLSGTDYVFSHNARVFLRDQ